MDKELEVQKKAVGTSACSGQKLNMWSVGGVSLSQSLEASSHGSDDSQHPPCPESHAV